MAPYPNMDAMVGVQSPAANDAVAPGSVVTLRVYQSAAAPTHP